MKHQETGLKPHQQGTFKVSKGPTFAEKVADIAGSTSTRHVLRLAPGHGAHRL